MNVHDIKKLKTEHQARTYAMDYQHYVSKNSLSLSEIMEFERELKKLAERFGLTQEFKENGII